MNSNALGRAIFDTGALPERDRFPAFCEQVARRTGLDIRTQNQFQFHATIEQQRLGSIEIGCDSITPVEFVRTTSLIRDGDDRLLFVLLKNGSAYQTQREDVQSVQPGDAIICDSAHPGALNIVTDAQFSRIKVPRQRIAKLFPQVARFGGMKLDNNPTARRLLFGYLGVGGHLDLARGDAVGALYDEHIIDLIALSLGAEGEGRELAERRGARVARRHAILREIARRSGDPALSAAAIAMLLGITPRYVHLLLEETGRSFSYHVLEQRLEKAALLLRDPRWSNRRIADIAAETGFTSLSYFGRVFRRHFGSTPSDTREDALHHEKH